MRPSAMAAVEVPTTTTGSVFVTGGTTDGEVGRYDHSNGSTNVTLKPIAITVEDIRATGREAPTVQRNGYQLVDFQTSLPEEVFLDDSRPKHKARIEDVYFEECRHLVQSITGAVEAFPYVYRVRNQEKAMNAISKADFHKDSVPIVHVDRDCITAPQRLRASLGEEKTDALLAKYKRYGSMNVWRPIRNPVEKWPLMLVDHSNIPDWHYDTHMLRLHFTNDTRVSSRGAKGHENMLLADKRYRYVYAADMQPNEAWLFYAFHSDARLGIPHSAFWDDGTRPDALPRWSIEVRVWVFFGDEELDRPCIM